MKNNWLTLYTLMFLFSFLLLNPSCKKADTDLTKIDQLIVQLPRLEIRHESYYQMLYTERSVEIEFNLPVDESSVAPNILFEDQSGELGAYYDLSVNGRTVLLIFKPGFQLKDGWKYSLTIKPGLRTASGMHFAEDRVLEIRTYIKHVGLDPNGSGPDSTQRNSIAVISDIHMGDNRATSLHYSWFEKNAGALEDFLDFVLKGNQVLKLVILGDLFDEWLIPYTMPPFGEDISSSDEYFKSVAANPVNAPIVDKLKEIALSDDIELVYVHGNHDMLLSRETLAEIIPNITWAGDVSGLGKYSPLDDMVMEHGHRYDFFNCPQPLVSEGHMLPPGYFVSRLYAQGLMDQNSVLEKELWDYQGSIEFLAAWEVAQLYTLLHFDMAVPDLGAANILMSGIDGYDDPFSFNGARDMFAADIEDSWEATQQQNEVPFPLNCCIQAIWNGHSDLLLPAMEEYIVQPPAPQTYKLVVFGHTHQALVTVVTDGGKETGIYANSGTWINSEECSYDVRTYLLVTPAEWTGSELDIVSLYQYNLDTENGAPVYKPKLINEESIVVEIQ